MSHNHQQVSKARLTSAGQHPIGYRDDPFSRLVGVVAADANNPFNIDRFLWVLEEPPERHCTACGIWFDPWFGYDSEASHGPARRYCSPRCRDRAAYERHRARLGRSCEVPYSELVGGRCSCRVCGCVFDPRITYDGRPFRIGRHRSCCSLRCQARLAGLRTVMAATGETGRAV